MPRLLLSLAVDAKVIVNINKLGYIWETTPLLIPMCQIFTLLSKMLFLQVIVPSACKPLSLSRHGREGGINIYIRCLQKLSFFDNGYVTYNENIRVKQSLDVSGVYKITKNCILSF